MRREQGGWRALAAGFWAGQSGQALVLAAACLVVLLGMAALAVDAGVLQYQKRLMQNAADAAALAGALELTACNGTSNCTAMRTAAQAALVENGLTGSTLGVQCAAAGNVLTLTLNNGPCAVAGDANVGNVAYVEAVVSEVVPTVFAKVLGVSTVKVAARAEAQVLPMPCTYWMLQSGSTSSLVLNNTQMQATCPIYMGDWYYMFSNSSSVGSQFLMAGPSSQSTGTVSPAPRFNYRKLPDPLASVPAPAVGGCSTGSISTSNQSFTGYPGVICGSVDAEGSGTITLYPGVYVVEGSLTINGPTVTGSGITFFITSGSGSSSYNVNIQNSRMNISAPTSGSQQGILFFTDRSLAAGSATVNMQNLSSGSTLDGIYYLPGQQFSASSSTLTGNNYFGVVSANAVIYNTNFLPKTNYSSLANGNPFGQPMAVLVE